MPSRDRCSRHGSVSGPLRRGVVPRHEQRDGGLCRRISEYQRASSPGIRLEINVITSIVGLLPTRTCSGVVAADRAWSAMTGDVLATDEVMRRVMSGVPFRKAYREVAAAVKRGETMPAMSASAIIAARTSAGAMGNLPIASLRRRASRELRWGRALRRRFDATLARLVRRRAR